MKRVEAFTLIYMGSVFGLHRYGQPDVEKPTVLIPKTEVGFPPPASIVVEVCVDKKEQ